MKRPSRTTLVRVTGAVSVAAAVAGGGYVMGQRAGVALQSATTKAAFADRDAAAAAAAAEAAAESDELLRAQIRGLVEEYPDLDIAAALHAARVGQPYVWRDLSVPGTCPAFVRVPEEPGNRRGTGVGWVYTIWLDEALTAEGAQLTSMYGGHGCVNPELRKPKSQPETDTKTGER